MHSALRNALLVFMSCFAFANGFAQSESANMAQLMAPHANGQLRASINLGNPILAKKDPATGLPVGVSVDLARALAQKLHLKLELVVFDSAGKSVQAVQEDKADIGFFAIDPKRGEGINFTKPYVIIEGSYLVRDDSPLRSNDEVDQAHNRVVVGQGSAYDLFLTREIKKALIVRAPTSPTVVDVFVHQGFEVAAGVTQQLQADLKRFDHLRLLPGRFMVIEQAMGLPKARDPKAHAYLMEFVQDMKRSGQVATSLAVHKIEGAQVAP
jgi:polar amino acid transport system substrate-binding protein